MKYFDAHTHLHDKAFDADREEVLSRMKEAGVCAITIGTDLERSGEAVALALKHEGLWAAIGLHPNDNKEEEFDAQAYAELMQNPKIVAVGECGLDYYRLPAQAGGGEEDKHRQCRTFEAQILFAVAHDKPLMIHCREAHEDALDILTHARREHGEKVRGVIHFFTATADIARRYLDLGFALSFPGVITFTDMYDASVQAAPLDRILSETDAPYAAPVPYRGKRNEPSYVTFTVERLAELKGVSEPEMREQIAHTAESVFGFPPFIA